MRNNKYQSKSSHAGMFSTDWSFFFATTMQVLRLSKAHFVEDSVFLDLVLNFVMQVNSVSP